MSPDEEIVQMRAEEVRIRAEYSRREKEVPASRYSVFDPANLAIRQSLERRILRLFVTHDLRELSKLKVLEVGCGTGHWLRCFIQWGARPELLAGMDLLTERIHLAHELTAPGVHFVVGNATDLKFGNDEFDLLCQFTMFSSVLSGKVRSEIASEMLRVLKPGGHILWYDFFVNNPINPNVRGIRRKEIRELFPGASIELARITVAPPILRAMGRAAPSLYCLLSIPKFLCTHYLGLIRKPL